MASAPGPTSGWPAAVATADLRPCSEGAACLTDHIQVLWSVVYGSKGGSAKGVGERSRSLGLLQTDARESLVTRIGRSEGLPVPREPALLASAGRMPKRSQHRVSEGQDARSERPATGHWQPRAARREETQVENLCYEGRPPTHAGRSSHIGHQSGVRGKSWAASFCAICVEGSIRPAATASAGSHCPNSSRASSSSESRR